MRREILAILLISTLVSAALDQTYIHTQNRDGRSEIVKTTDISIFTTTLDEEAFSRMNEVCETSTKLKCMVEGKKITITENLNTGNHYSFSTEYGLPFITYTLQQRKIPTDIFGNSLDLLLLESEVVSGPGGASAQVIDLRDKEENVENAGILRSINANLTYVIHMPSGISEAKAGNVTGVVSGNTVTFDIIEVMEESEFIVVKSNELNMGYIILIAAAIVFAALAVSFSMSRPSKRKK